MARARDRQHGREAGRGGGSRADLKRFLVGHDAYPLDDYFPFDPERDAHLVEGDWFAREEKVFGSHGKDPAVRGRISGSVRDDDVDYTVLGLHMIEHYGHSLSTIEIAGEWLHRFPAYGVATAEHAAYQNLVRQIPLDKVGEHHNPWREWIGALIRADIFGYVHPGQPRTAAVAAYQDAVLTHRANGIYGEMWAAALIASAFTARSPLESVEESLRHIPGSSRLAEEVRTVLEDWRAGLTWEECLDRLDRRHAALHFVHVVNNTGSLAAAILWGEGDFSATVGLTVQAGLDTDSAGATAGSWAGAFGGFEQIPARFVDPIEDRVRSAIFGYSTVSITSLVDRTLAVVGRAVKRVATA